MTSRLLGERDLNRAVLARQGLLEPFDEPLPRVLERVGGIQAQYAPAMYIGLWSRMRSFARSDLTRALQQRTVVQGTLLRGTIHLVSREDYWPFAVAVRAELREWFVKVSKGDPSQEELERAAKTVQAALHHRPLRQTEIDELVGRRNRAGINMVLDIVRIPPSGTWERRRADLHADAWGWLGPPDVSVLDAQVLLVRRYLGGFGPATRARDRELGRAPGAVHRRRARPNRPRDLRGRGRIDLGRPAGRAAARPGQPSPGAVPADVGRHVAGSRSARADPA
jgi:DNA glycosylase AlkZ-like